MRSRRPTSAAVAFLHHSRATRHPNPCLRRGPIPGHVRGPESLRLAALVREPEPMVGALPRRPNDVQRQRGANQDVSR